MTSTISIYNIDAFQDFLNALAQHREEEPKDAATIFATKSENDMVIEAARMICLGKNAIYLWSEGDPALFLRDAYAPVRTFTNMDWVSMLGNSTIDEFESDALCQLLHKLYPVCIPSEED